MTPRSRVAGHLTTCWHYMSYGSMECDCEDMAVPLWRRLHLPTPPDKGDRLRWSAWREA